MFPDQKNSALARSAATEAALPRVLLVEDYEASVLVTTTFLDIFGYAYDLAKDGHEAYAKAKEGDYVAILMDVQMCGLNGFETTQHIRRYEQENGKPPVRIIGITAHSLAGDRERCISAGMDDYMSKPFNPDTLSQKLALAAA